MSEEEKEAIEHIKESPTYREIMLLRIIDKLQKEFKDLELAYGLYKDRYETLQKENEALGRTLDDEIADNDRLQKENKELKEKNKELEKFFIKWCEQRPSLIHEDKIRTKIKELEELFDKNEKEITIQYQNQFIVDVVGVLEELLGDE